LPEVGQVRARWLGLGVMEISSPDYKQIVYVDALIINNWGFAGFNIPVPQNIPAWIIGLNILREKTSIVVFAITHNHGDHVGNLLDCVGNLTKEGINTAVVAQYEFATSY